MFAVRQILLTVNFFSTNDDYILRFCYTTNFFLEHIKIATSMRPPDFVKS